MGVYAMAILGESQQLPPWFAATYNISVLG
jgi:hypothetical protein